MTQTGGNGERFIRCIVLAKRKEGMTHEEFDRHWSEVHGAIARHYPNVVRYAQLHLVGKGTVAELADSDWGIDGIVDFVYTSSEDIPHIWESPAGLEGVADSANFLSAVTEYYVDEHVVTDHIGVGRLVDYPLISEPLRYPPRDGAPES